MSNASTGSIPGPQKRRRVEEELVKDPHIWMDDGNVAIAAVDRDDDTKEEKTTYVLKCHKSVLAKQSLVFETMFSMPPSGEHEDMYDGLPLVRLTDSYNDVKSLLRILYGEIPVGSPDVAHSMLFQVEGPLRLAAKYDLVALHDRLIQTLRPYWPHSLQDWDVLCETRRKDSALLVAAKVLKLGFEAQAPTLLPGAMYALHVHVASHTYQEFLDTTLTVQQPFDHASGLLEGLALSHVCQLMIGQERLRTVASHLRFDVLPVATSHGAYCLHRHFPDDDDASIASDDEPQDTPCTTVIMNWWKAKSQCSTYASGSDSRSFYEDPLSALDTLRRSFRSGGKTKICFGCRGCVDDCIQAAREYLWDEMRFFFELDTRNQDERRGYARYLRPYSRYVP
ncbi:hypothetical protein BDW22DRAFT_1353371 [Trametopsis cervina]|nr:hypothetical protein BDW22DRAFT_1353371 [Trametopsis cervina]